MEQPFYAIYMITYKLYHRLRKFARGNIDFIEDFSLGHAEYPPPKWQSRDLTAVCTELMVGLSEGVAALPGSNFQVAPWPLGACFAWYALLALALAALHRWDIRRRHMV